MVEERIRSRMLAGGPDGHSRQLIASAGDTGDDDSGDNIDGYGDGDVDGYGDGDTNWDGGALAKADEVVALQMVPDTNGGEEAHVGPISHRYLQTNDHVTAAATCSGGPASRLGAVASSRQIYSAFSARRSNATDGFAAMGNVTPRPLAQKTVVIIAAGGADSAAAVSLASRARSLGAHVASLRSGDEPLSVRKAFPRACLLVARSMRICTAWEHSNA